jgi:ribosomal protein L34E
VKRSDYKRYTGGFMITCHGMKKGEIYGCETCGIELQVIKTCGSEGKVECNVREQQECSFSCCGEELKKIG